MFVCFFKSYAFFFCFVLFFWLVGSLDHWNHQKRIFISFVFVFFFTHSFQTFDYETETLSISSSGEFTSGYKDVTKHIVIESGVDTIQYNAFYHWTSLLTAEISGTVTSIRSNAFCACYALEAVSIGEGLTQIGSFPIMFFIAKHHYS